MAIDGIIRNQSSLWYLIGIGMGFETCCLLVNCESEDEAMGIYADSKYAHLTEVELKDLNDHLIPERKEAIDLMEQIRDEAEDAIDQLENQYDYKDYNLDQSGICIRDWANDLSSIDWDNDELHSNLTYLGNESKPHQLDELRLFECIPKSQIDFFHKKTDLMFDPKRNQQF